MKKAIECAKKAASKGEVPVGAVIVKDGKIIARGENARERKKNALSHAEIIAINKACKKLGGWRLVGCTLYVTLEPCPMCAGAIINSRIECVVYGAKDEKAGSFGSVMNMLDFPNYHYPVIRHGILADQCGQILSDFFKQLRNK